MKRRAASPNDRKLMDRLSPDPAWGRLLGIQATTYELQAEFFETDFLPTVLGLGAWDDRNWTSRIALEKHLGELEAATVLMDAQPYRARPRSLRVEIEPIPLGLGRALHSKVLLCVYENAVLLAVGSANLTEPGYRRNREVAAILTASAKQSAGASLIADAIRQMGTLLDARMTAGARHLCDLALVQLDNWSTNEAIVGQWFVWGGSVQPLWQQFIDRWPAGEAVQRITIVSPFWSEERGEGPITRFVTTLRQADALARNAELRLLTEAAPDTQATYKPRLPESFAHFDAGPLEIIAHAAAVDPRVPSEEVGMGEEFTGTRALHAKVVLLEGADTSLAYLGSANFSRHGWGFLPDPRLANIEAGLVVRRSGPHQQQLRSLIPNSTGDAVPLDGAATGRLALPDPSPDHAPWPTFLKEIVLEPSADPDQLELAVTLATEATGPWRIRLLPTEIEQASELINVTPAQDDIRSYRIPLNEEVLNQLMRDQEAHVEWWEHVAGRSFPINVAPAARMALPIGPGTGHPREHQLLAYYQGRITWEDLFPDPEAPTGQKQAAQDRDDESGVDTSRIQSYVVREFVEALKGIQDDLKLAAQSSKACMRLALLGPVSPIALARRVFEAAETGQRTPMACGFQLVEILACLDAARQMPASDRFRQDWHGLVAEAANQTSNMLEAVQRRFPTEFSNHFRRYAKQVRRHYLTQEAIP